MGAHILLATSQAMVQHEVFAAQRAATHAEASFIYVGPGGVPNTAVTGWFTCQRRGFPFDWHVADKVAEHLVAEGVGVRFGLKPPPQR